MQTLHSREPELLFALLAMAGRFLEHPMSRISADDYLEKSRRLVMGRICEGRVELSTLQTLCLLSMVDFTSKWRARLSPRHVLNQTQMETQDGLACMAVWQSA